MTSIASEELEPGAAALVQRAAAGEDVTITVAGEHAVRLVPAREQLHFIGRDEFFAGLRQADAGLRQDLDDMLGGETTDDLPW